MLKNIFKNFFNSSNEQDIDKQETYKQNNEEYNNKQIYSYNQDNQDNQENQEDKIDKQYIDTVYGKKLIDPLMGYDKETNLYLFYINKNNAMDIKLPFEFLSPIKTIKSNSNNTDNIVFELNVDDNYEDFLIHFVHCTGSKLSLGVPLYSRRWLNSNSYKNFSSLNYGQGIEYNFTYYYHVDKEKLKRYTESSESMIKLIDEYKLNSESIIDYYIALVKKNQPTLDEMYNILIKFEKAKKSLNKIKVIDQSQKLNTMLENSKIRSKDQFDKIDKELLSLVKSNHN